MQSFLIMTWGSSGRLGYLYKFSIYENPNNLMHGSMAEVPDLRDLQTIICLCIWVATTHRRRRVMMIINATTTCRVNVCLIIVISYSTESH